VLERAKRWFGRFRSPPFHPLADNRYPLDAKFFVHFRAPRYPNRCAGVSLSPILQFTAPTRAAVIMQTSLAAKSAPMSSVGSRYVVAFPSGPFPRPLHPHRPADPTMCCPPPLSLLQGRPAGAAQPCGCCALPQRLHHSQRRRRGHQDPQNRHPRLAAGAGPGLPHPRPAQGKHSGRGWGQGT
jgi:hypothetical protein